MTELAHRLIGRDVANSVQQTSDGGFVLTGGCDATILKLDDDGNIVWLNDYGGTSAFSASSVRQTSDDWLVVAGAIFGTSQAWVAKLDADGLVGASCSFVTPVSGTTQSDTSATITSTSSTVTDTSSLDTVTNQIHHHRHVW